MPTLQRFFSELRRRHVFKVTAAYGIVAWLLIQVAATVSPLLELPGWAPKLVLLLVLLGFPVALLLAWAFELTPDGFRRTESIPLGDEAAPRTARRMDPRAAGWVGVGILVGLVSVGAYGWTRVGGGEGAEIRSVAVFPFTNLSRDPENEFFSDGISEEVLNALAKIEGLRVPARTSAFRFKGADVDLREAARQLNVEAILEGSVRRAGDRIRITAQLVDAESGYRLWSETYDRQLVDIFAVQEEIAREIVTALRVEIGVEADARLARRPTESVEAHTLYLRGRHVMQRRSLEGLEQAIRYFEAAIAVDPDYAAAHSGLADAHYLLSAYGFRPQEEGAARARGAALRALSLDSMLPEAHISGAFVRLTEYNPAGAESALRRAIELNPNHAMARHYRATVLCALGRLDEAIGESRRSVELDPLSPVTNNFLGLLLYYAGDLDGALAQYETALRLEPTYVPALGNSARVYAERSQFDRAFAAADRGIALGSPLMHLARASVYARKGQRGQAVEAMRTARESLPAHHRPAAFAEVYIALGDLDAAMEWLEQADWNGNSIYSLRASPGLEPIRSDPRYARLLERLGLR